MNQQSKINFLINALYFAFIAALVVIAAKYVVAWFLPFILAFLIATAAYSIVGKIGRQGRINEKVSATLLVILIYAILGCVLTILVSNIILTADKFADRFSGLYQETLVPAFESVAQWIDNILSHISPEFGHLSDMTFQEFYTNFENVITLVSERTIVFAGKLVRSIPSIITSFLITIISSILLSLSYRKTMAFLREKLPKKITKVVSQTKQFVTTSVFKMLKAYTIIVLITFGELSLGFLILGVEKPFLLAFVIALVDILPIIGLGIVLIPWIIICLIQKNFFLGIGLAVMYLIITVLRNIIEPKIVGDQIGLPPLVSLIAVYVGFKAMGVLGIFIFPIALIVVRDLIRSGTIKLW